MNIQFLDFNTFENLGRNEHQNNAKNEKNKNVQKLRNYIIYVFF